MITIMLRKVVLISLLLIGIIQCTQASPSITWNKVNRAPVVGWNKVNRAPVVGWKGVNKGPKCCWNSVNKEVNNTSSNAVNNITNVSMNTSSQSTSIHIDSSTGLSTDGSNNELKPFVDEHTRSNGNIAGLNTMIYVILFSVFILITNSSV